MHFSKPLLPDDIDRLVKKNRKKKHMTAKQPAPVDVEKLKEEAKDFMYKWVKAGIKDEPYRVELLIDHLHERNLLNTAQEVEGLEEAVAACDAAFPSCADASVIVKAARAYLELTKGKG